MKHKFLKLDQKSNFFWVLDKGSMGKTIESFFFLIVTKSSSFLLFCSLREVEAQ